jgi:hypothetical protein
MLNILDILNQQGWCIPLGLLRPREVIQLLAVDVRWPLPVTALSLRCASLACPITLRYRTGLAGHQILLVSRAKIRSLYLLCLYF